MPAGQNDLFGDFGRTKQEDEGFGDFDETVMTKKVSISNTELSAFENPVLNSKFSDDGFQS